MNFPDEIIPGIGIMVQVQKAKEGCNLLKESKEDKEMTMKEEYAIVQYQEALKDLKKLTGQVGDFIDIASDDKVPAAVRCKISLNALKVLSTIETLYSHMESAFHITDEDES